MLRIPHIAALGVLAASTILAAPGVASAHAPRPSLTPPVFKKVTRDAPCTGAFRQVKGQGLSCRTTGGLWKVKLRNGTTLLTHGPDPAPAGSGASGVISSNATPRKPTCSSTQRIRAILAVPPEGGNQTVAGVRDQINRANGVFFHAAVESGSPGANLRFACDGSGEVAVHVMRMTTPNSRAGWSSIVAEIDAEATRQGWSKANEKFYIHYDARPGTTGAGGQGTLLIDDTDSATNANNKGGSFAINYDSGFSTVLHEIGHNLGAVQPGAPLATGRDAGYGNWGHCYESWDVMCYNDRGSTDPGYIVNNCPDFDHFDCGHDSYFDAKIGAGQGGQPGSYIDTHWNIGDCHARFVDNAACSSGADTTAPTATAPVHVLPTGSQMGTGTMPVRLSWSGADTGGSGLARYTLWQSVDGAAYTQLSLASATATTSTRLLAPGHTYRFVVGAIDAAGNQSAYAYGVTFRAEAHQETSTQITYSGSWPRYAWASAFGGYERTASAAGATATFRFTGRSVAWVAPTATNRGRAYVYLDGTYLGWLDMYSASTVARKVVFSRNWSTSAAHTLAVRVVGTSGRPSIDVDAFTVLR